MLEVHFLVPALLDHGQSPLERPWRERLVEDLITPSFKCSFAFALGRRFVHIYGALHLFVLLGWGTLVSFGARTPRAWVESFGLGEVPGSVMLTLVLLYITVLAVAIIRSGALRAQSGEVRRYYREWTASRSGSRLSSR